MNHPAFALDPRQLIERVSNWIKEYAGNAGITSLVVGVSGGIDSAVVTRLCQNTDLRTIAVAMPMWLARNDGDPTALQRAMELCVHQPKLEFHIREIGPIVEAYLLAGAGSSQLLQGNLRSRVRANILCDFAGANNGLVVGTGNEDEDEIGYFTKWGDGAVDLCPLSKVHKSKVYQMAAYLNIPLLIRNILPTAGLWEGQTDAEELGMVYDEVEWAIEHDKAKSEESLTERQTHVLAMVRDRRRKNAHKLHYPPIFDPWKD